MTSLDFDNSTNGPVVKIVTENPVGYRYTVYDSIDPVRIVIDFPGMDVDSILSLKDLSGSVVESVDVSSFDLTSGKLGRVEIVLANIADYDVSIENTEFQLSFTPSAQAMPTDAVVSGIEESTPAESDTSVDDDAMVVSGQTMTDVPDVVEAVTLATAEKITGVNISASSVHLQADGPVDIFKYFTLGAPSRLVLDVYGLKAGFKQRTFEIGDDFGKMRVGAYDDKIRFVFDAAGEIPDYSVDTQGNSVVISWGGEIGSSLAMSQPVQAGGPVNVEAVDFSIEGDTSVLRVTLNASSSIIKPTKNGDIVGFGVKNATISRALRRTVDASSFPSSIRLVTPYTVQVGEQQDVRFAVELKGPSEYELVEDGNVILFKVVNGPFAEPDPMTAQVAVEVPDVVSAQIDDVVTEDPVPDVDDVVTNTQVATDASVTSVSADIAPTEADILGGDQVQAYSGQRISLVFDNAEIRNILQLIAEVSNLNILAGDGVDGTITLRLIDVPWDQALDLILDTKDLGIIRDGNVAKILPKESIRSMDEAKFSAKRTQEKLEDLTTEVIKISYTDLKNVTKPVKALLTTRGRVTEDSRNKQLIVTDIKRNIEKIKALAAILDTPERQVLIEARVVEVSTTANLDLGVNWGLSHSQNPAGSGNYDASVSLGGNFTITPALGVSGVGSAFQWGQIGVNTTILDLRLSALEARGEGRVVSNPRIMALNGEKAKITQGTLIPYQTVQDGEISTEFIEAALSLEVVPVINPDNSVILTVKVSNSAPGASAGQIDKKEAETKMLVANGETMVIGGVFVEVDTSAESGVPILMDIPLLGNLFKSRNAVKTRTELMVFITPRIIE
jgi:type IV pilus assembly protein PilQ